MATVTRYIYSHYDPKDRETLEKETGQVPSGTLTADAQSPQTESGEADPWQTENTFGLQRRLAAAPRFVPAAISYDEINNMLGGFSREVLQPPAEEPKTDVSSWYRSLTRRDGLVEANTSTPISQKRSITAPVSIRAPLTTTTVQPRPDKNNWFIARALRSEPSSSPATPPPTLADILERDPPALSSQQALKPPVFLTLGPSNRGWGMLQQKGWSEGEGLGANVARRAARPRMQNNTSMSSLPVKADRDRVVVKTEQQEVQLDSDGDISEMRQVEVVDLTLSDSEEDEAKVEEGDLELLLGNSMATVSGPSTSHSTPLLTPVPTVLKSDRLGVGLKAKTEGPYKASKKRVTHNQAALAAHIQANEEMRRLKAKVGRGTRGFARLAKADSEQRRQLLASLNQD